VMYLLGRCSKRWFCTWSCCPANWHVLFGGSTKSSS